jgi:hypothetical protein
VAPAGGTRSADSVEVVGHILAHEAADQVSASQVLAEPADGSRFAASPLAFVLFALIEFAFVFGLLILTKREPSQVLQIAGGTTTISVIGYFGRNAVVIIGRRVINGSGKQ